MKNEQVSLSLSLCLVTFQEVNPKGFIFLSFFPVYDDRVFLLDFFPLLLTLQDATSLRTLLFSFLSGHFRTNTVYLVILHAVHVFSINFIVFASLLREGIETLPDYYFVNFVLFTIGDVYTVYSELNFSRILKLFNLSNLLKSTKKFSTYRFKEYRLETLDIPL